MLSNKNNIFGGNRTDRTIYRHSPAYHTFIMAGSIKNLSLIISEYKQNPDSYCFVRRIENHS
jgi:hypothetical protein